MSRCLLLVLLLMVNVAKADVTAATDVPVSNAVPVNDPSIVDPCIDYPLDAPHQRWWDSTHRRFSRAICWPSRWVDHFFAKPDLGDNWDQAGTTLMVTQEATVRDDDQNANPLKVNAHIELPNLEHRFSLLFVNEDDIQDGPHSTIADQSGEQQARPPGGFQSALRWALRTSQRISLDWDVGLRSGLHGYSQIRYRWRKSTSENGWVRLTQKVYFLDPEGFSSDSLAEYNYTLSPVSGLRFASETLVSEKNNEDGIGWVISHSAAYYFRLSDRSAIQYQVGTYAYTRPAWATQDYRLGIRYRRNFLRPWLFYEVEPFWEWPKAENFGTVTGITLRLEVLFGFYNGNGL